MLTIQGYFSTTYYAHRQELEKNALEQNKELICKQCDEKELKALDDKVRKWEAIGDFKDSYELVGGLFILSIILTVAFPIFALMGSSKLAMIGGGALCGYAMTYTQHLNVSEMDKKIADEMVLKAQLIYHQRITVDLYHQVKQAFPESRCSSKDPQVQQSVIDAVYAEKKKLAIKFMNERLKEEANLDLSKMKPDEFVQFVFDFYHYKNAFPQKWSGQERRLICSEYRRDLNLDFLEMGKVFESVLQQQVLYKNPFKDVGDALRGMNEVLSSTSS